MARALPYSHLYSWYQALCLALADTSVLVLAIGNDCWHPGLTSHGESELKTSWNHIKTEKKEIIFKLKMKL